MKFLSLVSGAKTMSQNNIYDLVIIGAGPAGEVGAIRAAQLGLKVALIERYEHLGGTCLNWGCIPTKALLEAAKFWKKLQNAKKLGFSIEQAKPQWDSILKRKEGIVSQQRKGLLFLMKKNKVDVFSGQGKIKDPSCVLVEASGKEKTRELRTRFILIATGSRISELPFAKANGKNILNSDMILSISGIPKTMAVIGGGVVGVEFASLFSRFGTKVTLYEMMPQILPTEDSDCVKELVKVLRRDGVKVACNLKLSAIKEQSKACVVSVEGGEDKTFEKVLVSIGRSPVTDNLGLEELGLKLENNFIPVDAHYRTKLENIFAVGDVINTPALAHTASAEAKHAVEVMAGKNPIPIDYMANPSAIYSYPEIASIGLTEKQAFDQEADFKVTKFPFMPMAKAKIEDSSEGFIKIISGKKYGELLGVHIVGAKATELISEFVLGKILEATVEEIGLAIHPHPTISETILEAAHAAEDQAIHM